jgi:hypothetical protein
MFETASQLHFTPNLVKRVPVEDFAAFPVAQPRSFVCAYPIGIGVEMLARNESYREIVQAFNRGGPKDWSTYAPLHSIASGWNGKLNPKSWYHKYSFFISEEMEKGINGPNGPYETYSELFREDCNAFTRENKISMIIEEEFEGINVYLVFRALLFGALLDTGADNSCLLDLDYAQQVVPML